MEMAMRPDRRKTRPTNIAELGRAESRGDDFHMFGRAEYHPGGWVGPRRQSVYFFITILEGSVAIDCDGRRIEVGCGQGVVLPPDGLEFYRFDRSVRSVHNWCQISSAIPTKEERVLLRKTLKVVAPVPAGVNILIEEGLSTPMNAGPDLRHAMRTLAKACLLRFAAHATEGAEARRLQHPAVARAVDAIATRPAAFHSAEELAKHCGISYSRLRKLFQEDQGESPSHMIWRFKTEHAVQLIRATGLTLAEIADQCGFSNAFHLSRCVKECTGLPPRELRRTENQKPIS